jgi:NarL family two-component system response regulator LiaR
LNLAEELSLFGSSEETPGKTRIMLVDDHPLVRQALTSLLKKQPDFEVVAQANDGEEAVNIAAKIIPDIIIMDITMPKLNGLDATRRIKAKYPGIGILVLTVHSDNEHVLGILQAGADGFLIKTASDGEIVQAVRALAAGDTVLSPAISGQIFRYAFQCFKKPVGPVMSDRLTMRELETLRLAAKGIPNKEIAARLGISLRSAKAYMTNVFQKLNVASRTEAIAVSLQLGILTLEDLNQ